MSTTVGYSYDHNGASTSGNQTNADNSRTPDGPQHQTPQENSPEPADSMLNTSTDSNDDDAHADAQLLSASILATIQSTPRHHATPNRFSANGTPKSSTPYLNGRSGGGHDSYSDSFHQSRERDEELHKDNSSRRNGKTNNNMYPPSPTANITPRRRSTRVVKSAKPFPLRDNERDKKEKEKEKEKRGGGSESTTTKRDSKSISGSGAKRARKRIAAANEADVPQPVAVLGRNLDLTTLLNRTGEPENAESSDVFVDPNWAESVSLYALARSWMCSGVDLDPFHILRHDTAESVLLDMHDYIPPPELPPPSTSTLPALPERPRYPSSTDDEFQAALKKGGDNSPKVLLKNYISNCKTFRTWWKANYTQRLSRYKGRLAVLFPSAAANTTTTTSTTTTTNTTTTSSTTPSASTSSSDHTQRQTPQTPQTPTQQPPSSHPPRTPSPPPRQAHQPHRTPSPPPRQSLLHHTPTSSQSPSQDHQDAQQAVLASQQMPPPPQPPQPPQQLHPPSQQLHPHPSSQQPHSHPPLQQLADAPCPQSPQQQNTNTSAT